MPFLYLAVGPIILWGLRSYSISRIARSTGLESKALTAVLYH
jgi:hypothetical protein